MAARDTSDKGGKPLTLRLLAALLFGSLLLAYVVTQLALEQEQQRHAETTTSKMRDLAKNLASRAAPLLAEHDDLRLATLAASATQLGGERLLFLDHRGLVRLDTGLALGGTKLSVITAPGGFVRNFSEEQCEALEPVVGLRGLVGEVRVRYANPKNYVAAFSLSLFAGAFLACLSLIALACYICHHWLTHVREAVEVAYRLSRGETDAVCTRKADGEIRDLQLSLRYLAGAVKDGVDQMHASFLEIASQMVELLERRGQGGHGERVCRYAMILGERLGLSTQEAADLQIAARLHDIGEAWLRPALLEKQASLTEDERNCLRHLPGRSASLLSGLPTLKRAADIIRHHREKYDGTGYPEGLRGDRIPLGARVLAIADAYDQWTTCNLGGQPLDWGQALDKLREDRGTHFDPWLLDLFEEEICSEPVPESPMNLVMISTSGVLPYKVAQVPNNVDDLLSEDYELYCAEDDELEVLNEDSLGEDSR